jgi:citrate lyase beta subunit
MTHPLRQPVHTVYGGAHLFKADLARKLGGLSLRAFNEHAPDAAALGAAFGLDEATASAVHPRVVEKLQREPVEDYRIDFEDGFGHRPDEEEDRTAEAAAGEVAAGMAGRTLPPGIGIRIKPLNSQLAPRGLRTLDLFISGLVAKSGGAIPSPFVVTLPKVTAPSDVAALADACDACERTHRLAPGSIAIEVMVETPEALFAPDGRLALPSLIAAGAGRVRGAHFGPFDYTAAFQITAAHQDIRHPACDFARQIMLVALAPTTVSISDGPTPIMPVGPRDAVHRAWKLHAGNVRHALVNGIYQGWDLHPAQLPSRYTAVFAFFLEGLAPASERLKNFVQKAAQATLVGDVFDDAATGQGLLNYFLRAMQCGAITEAEAVERSGLTVDEIRGRSFGAIVTGRRGR